jgi:hypothetical protein
VTDSAGSESDTSHQPVAATTPPSWTPDSSAQQTAVGVAAEHPELIVAAAFTGGLLLATILKRIAH